jgi:hypothetical protein
MVLIASLIKDQIQYKYVKKKAPKSVSRKVHFLCPPILNYVTIIVNGRYVIYDILVTILK